MKYSILARICYCVLIAGYLCIANATGYTRTSAPFISKHEEQILFEKHFHTIIDSIQKNNDTIIIHTKKALSLRDTQRIKKAIASSVFVVNASFTSRSITLQLTSPFVGYILSSTTDGGFLTLFQDATDKLNGKTFLAQANTPATRGHSTPPPTSTHQENKNTTVQPIKNNGYTKATDSISKNIKNTTNSITKNTAKKPIPTPIPTTIEKVAPRNTSIQQHIATVNPELSPSTITQQIEIIEGRKTLPVNSQITHIREQIQQRNPNTTLFQTFGLGIATAQTTGKMRINRGGPENWNATRNTPSTNSNPNTSSNNTTTVSIPTTTPSIHIGEEIDSTTIIPQKKSQNPTTKNAQRIQNVKEQINAVEQQNAVKEKTTIPKPPITPSKSATLVESTEEKEQRQQAYDTNKNIAISFLNRGEYKVALNFLKNLAREPISKEEQEELLYLIAEVTEVLSRTEKQYIPEAIQEFTVAMNYNLQSPNVPDALLHLGLLHATLKNTKDVEAYFSLIRTKYPQHKNIPLTHYYLGKYYQDEKLYSLAINEFKTIESTYPKFEFLKETIVALIQSLDTLGLHNDAKPYTAFIDSRWPTLYHTYPDILLIKAKLHYDLKEYPVSLESYWQYVNILPTGKDMDMILARIGDMYFLLGEKEKARTVYKSIVQKHKGTEGYVLAKLRLAEDIIIDDITDDSQFLALVDKSYNTIPRDTYLEILKEYPQSSFAPLAEAKLAMWYFWYKEYNATLATADSFLKKYPTSDIKPSVIQLIARTLNALSLIPEKQKEIPALWQKYSSLFTTEESLNPEYRLHIAQALAKENEVTNSISMIQPFFKGRRYKDISEEAILLALGLYKKNKNWKQIEDLYYRVLDWDLSTPIFSTVLFNTALAFDEMKEYDKANALFERIFASVFTTPYYKGVSAYYIAEHSLRLLMQPKEIFPFAQEGLNNLLLASKNPPPSISKEEIDSAIIRSLIQLRNVSRKIGAFDEALRYTILQEQYEPNNMLLQIEKARLLKQLGNEAQWKSILEDIIAKNPTSSYAKLAQSELTKEQNKESLRGLGQ